MKKSYLFLALLGLIFLFAVKVQAQGTEPGLGLPLLDDVTSTATTTSGTYTTTPITTYSTITPTTYTTTTSSLSQQAVDDADTGSEVVVLVILSITGGVGIFLIKKYFDFKRYSL